MNKKLKHLLLPVVVKPNVKKDSKVPLESKLSQIWLGDNVFWNPLKESNRNAILVGTSGAGKTQSLLAIAYSMRQCYPDTRIILIDFHGDQELPDEQCYQLSQRSEWGINPLQIDLDPDGGGSKLQALSVIKMLKNGLVLGPVQEGVLVDAINDCYVKRGIYDSNYLSWTRECPNFKDLEHELVLRESNNCKDSAKLRLKLAALFAYSIFSRPMPPMDAMLIRFDMSALLKVPSLAFVAVESLLKQILDTHRLMELSPHRLRTFVFIDEARLVKNSPNTLNICRDGRKYGLGVCLASQRPHDFNDDALANSSLKIVLFVDPTEQKRCAMKFKINEDILASLQPFEAVVRVGSEIAKVNIEPFYKRTTVIAEQSI